MSNSPVVSPSTPAGWLGEHRGPLTVDDDFAILDDPIEQAEFTQTQDTPNGPVCESVLMVQGMYCAACADTVEGALQGQAGVESAQVHAATRRLVVRWNPAHIQMSELARRVGRTGYRLLPMQQALSVEQRLAETRQALWRLFVAGFCMMQVMMYAWPAYVTAPGEIPYEFDQLLRWASLVLSIPVVLFSSTPFFRSAWHDLKQGRIGMDTPVSIGILACFVVSVAATYQPTGPWGYDVWYDSLTMFVFFLLGGRYLEFKARDRTAGALDALMNRLPEQCERQLPNGQFETISLKRMVVGDVVRVLPGHAFPADGQLISLSASVDEALLTGESKPVTRQQGDTVVAGSFNLAASVLIRVQQLGHDTRFAQIVNLMERASIDKPRLARLADRIAAPFLVVVLLCSAFAGYYWWQIDPTQAVAVAVAVLIVTCPCALSLATPVAMLSAAGALAKRGILVRRLQAFESLSQVDTVVFDKTGTLTQDRVVLRHIRLRSGVTPEQALQWAASLAAASLHPVSRAICAHWLAQAELGGLSGVHVDTSLTVTETPGAGLQAHDAQGQTLRLGSASFCNIQEAALSPSQRAEPDAPCAYLADTQGWVATFIMEEDVRDDAVSTLARLHSLGLRTHVLSGDREAAVQCVARQVGVQKATAQASPEGKLQVVSDLQAQGHHIAMVGDGLNDGPVLARAHVSFALGHGAPLTQSQSDFVVQSGRLSEVADTFVHARRTMRIVRQNLVWAASYNAVSIPMALLGWMPPWVAGLGMALSSFLVIGNAMRLTNTSKPVSESAQVISTTPILAR